MKQEAQVLDATPSKRLYLSIIADYDINKAVCELVDNALDIWTLGQRATNLAIDIDLDQNQQRIGVTDNSGGVAQADLSNIIGPGHTKTSELDETIGIFGVGTKRAVVALAQQVRIYTRQNGDTFLIEFDDDWIKQSDDWKLVAYRVDPIPEGTTQIELVKLRTRITENTIEQLRMHLSATYAIFLKNQMLHLSLNRTKVTPMTFENWAFPPDYEPRIYNGDIRTQDGNKVHVSATAGLTTESSPAGGEYGVYFYCNDRLIVRALKTFDVGFATGLSGKPHADISLARVIIKLNGPARLMPWNSSKSEVNPSHQVFQSMRSWLLQVVKDYTSLSRRLSKAEGGWHENIFKYPSGNTVEVAINDFPNANTSYLPPLPEAKPRYGSVMKRMNKNVSAQRPWTTGLYESVVATDWILKQSLEQKNRIALIILDSTLEIAFKEFLVNDSGTHYSDKNLLGIFAQRHLVHQEVKKYVRISKSAWKKINHYYRIRCQLVHQRVTVAIPDPQIDDFRNTVETVLKKLFKLQFAR